MYDLTLTGPVGQNDFNADFVRSKLNNLKGRHVDILIDSFGGSLAEGLSICGALRDHGDVTVHYRGMNASAATIVSLGAKAVEIAPESFYLVHKASMSFLDWAQRNADELQSFIDRLCETKEELDVIDRHLAKMYASRCRRPVKDLLDLMTRGRWLTADEALDFGFVDSIADAAADGGKDATASITRSQADEISNCGLPLPPVPIVADNRNFLTALLDGIKNIINMHNDNSINNGPQPEDNAQPDAQNAQDSQDTAQTHDNAQPDNVQPDNNAAIDALSARLDALTARLDALTAPAPAIGSAVTADAAPAPAQPQKTESGSDPLTAFCKAGLNARKLFDSIP